MRIKLVSPYTLILSVSFTHCRGPVCIVCAWSRNITPICIMHHPSKTTPRLAVVLAALLTLQSALSFAGKIGLSVRTPTSKVREMPGTGSRIDCFARGHLVQRTNNGKSFVKTEAACISFAAAVVTGTPSPLSAAKDGEPATDPPCNE